MEAVSALADTQPPEFSFSLCCPHRVLKVKVASGHFPRVLWSSRHMRKIPFKVAGEGHAGTLAPLPSQVRIWEVGKKDNMAASELHTVPLQVPPPSRPSSSLASYNDSSY